MHFPSLSAIKSSNTHKDLFARITAKSGVKMKALIAVQRKILELIYIIYKNEATYEPDYEEKKRVQLQVTDTLTN